MSENLEIEFKTLLSIEEFSRVIDYFQFKEEQFFTQINYYFDSADFQLRKRRMGLRVRVLSDNAEITLKIPEKVGLLEINDALSVEEAKAIVESATLPTIGNVYNKLNQLGIDQSDLRLIGSLTTKRAELKLPQGLLALDESWYNEQHVKIMPFLSHFPHSHDTSPRTGQVIFLIGYFDHQRIAIS